MSRSRRLLGVGLAVGGLSVLRRWVPINDPDYFWHLHTGRYILEAGVVPATDPFSHTFFGQPWEFVDALADVALFSTWWLGGHAAVIVATALIGAVIVLLGLGTARAARRDAPAFVLLLIGVLLATAILPRATPRPQVFSFLCLAAVLALFEAAEDEPRWLLAVPGAIALWQNLHASGTLGVVVMALYAATRFMESRWTRTPLAGPRALLVACVSSPLALLATPRPFQRLAAGFQHASDARMGEFITEWAPFWVIGYRAPSGVAFLVLVVLGLLGVGAALRARRRLDRVALALLFTAMALQANRFVPFAALGLGGLALHGLDALRLRLSEAARPVFGAFALAGCVGLQLWQFQPPSLGLAQGAFPEDAARFLRAEAPEGKMFNAFRFGGYLLFELEGAYKVFIDGRSFALYGMEFTNTVLKADLQTLNGLFERYGVGFAVMATTNAPLQWMQSREDWSLVYFDDVAFVAVRNVANPRLAETHAYRALHPVRWMTDIAALKADPARLEAGVREAARAQEEAPRSALARLLGVAVALARGDTEGASRAADEALSLKPGYPPALGAKLMACLEARRTECVCAVSGQLLESDPRQPYALEARRALSCDAPSE